MKNLLKILGFSLLLLAINSCADKPEGLSEAELIQLIEKTITENPQKLKSKFAGFTGGLDEMVILDVEVSNIRYHGKGTYRGQDRWTVKFDAKGSVAASGERGGLYSFQFDHRTQVSKPGENWYLEF